MSAAVAMRLVPEPLVPRALSMIFTGVSAATILAAPVGSYLGEIIGWRNVFLITLVLGVVTLVVQLATLPSMAPSGLTRLRTLVEQAVAHLRHYGEEADPLRAIARFVLERDR